MAKRMAAKQNLPKVAKNNLGQINNLSKDIGPCYDRFDWSHRWNVCAVRIVHTCFQPVNMSTIIK